MTITIEKCPCGHPLCTDYHLRGIGKFTQGSGFTQEEAQRIADLLNAPPAMTPKGETIPQTVENLQAIMARDAGTMMEMDVHTKHLRFKLNQAQQIIRKLRSQKRYWLK